MPKALNPKLDPLLSRQLALVEASAKRLPSRITSEKEYSLIEEANADAVRFKKAVVAFFKKLRDPLNAALKDLKQQEEAFTRPADDLILKTKPLISSWALLQEREAEKQAKIERKELARDLGVPLSKAPEVEVRSSAEREGLSFKSDVQVEVLDLSLVPRGWLRCELNLLAVKEAWKADPRLRIPGLRLTETRVPVRRG